MKKRLPFLPAAKPKLELDALFSAYIPKQHQDELFQYDVFIVWVKSYYQNDIDLTGYNDAMFVVYRNGGTLKMLPFNGSCNPVVKLSDDPNSSRKGTPVLDVGKIYAAYVLGEHKGAKSNPYRALCQRVGDVSVTRIGSDGRTPYTDVGRFGINLHRGGKQTLNSEGCMTMPPTQFSEFMSAMERLLGSNQYDLPIDKRTVVPIVVYNDRRIK